MLGLVLTYDIDGAYVRALRHHLRLSQMDFASKLGKEKVTVHRWEVGGIDELTWLGLLSKCGISSAWAPSDDEMRQAEDELQPLRERRDTKHRASK